MGRRLCLQWRYKIAYRDYGPSTGDPILLVQGLGGQLINWPDHLLDFLIDNGYRPIVFDNRDTGLSTRMNSDLFSDENRSKTINSTYIRYFLRLPIKTHTLDDMANDSIAILDQLAIEKSHLLGMSMGGNDCTIIAANHKDRIKSFTLIASSTDTPSPINGPTRDKKIINQQTANPNATMG